MAAGGGQTTLGINNDQPRGGQGTTEKKICEGDTEKMENYLKVQQEEEEQVKMHTEHSHLSKIMSQGKQFQSMSEFLKKDFGLRPKSNKKYKYNYRLASVEKSRD